jgi:type I restriction enzyme S subunit
MELRKGYKQTEEGLIPTDWDVVLISDLAQVIRGASPRPKGDPRYYGGNIPRLMVEDITRDKHWIKPCVDFLTSEGAKLSRLCPVGTLILVCSGTPSAVGLPGLLGIEACIHDGILALVKVKKNISQEFLFYRFSYMQKKLFDSATHGGTFVNLTTQGLREFKLPIPTLLKEQTAIATALSDMDNLINSLSTLIEKKKAIKQGAMQQLLKPKEGWERKSLKDLAKYRRGSFPQPYGLDKWYDDISGSPFVQVYDVDGNFKLKEETKRKISNEAKAMSVFIEKGSIIITLQGSIGRIAITQYDAYLDRTLLFFESFIVPFNKYFFALTVFLLFEKEKEIAPGGIIKTITKEALSSFTIAYPSIEEQDRIATIFLDIENEIIALEQRLSKYQILKQGMTQELLTGKTRLV